MSLLKKIGFLAMTSVIGISLLGCSSKTVVNLYGEGNLYTTLKNDNLLEMNEVKSKIWLENIDKEDGVTIVHIKPTITAVGENIDYKLLPYLEVVFNNTELGNIQVENMVGYDQEGVIADGSSQECTLVGMIPKELTEEQMLDVGRVVYKMGLDNSVTYCSVTDMDFMKSEEERDKDTIENSKKEIDQLKNQ